MEEVKDTDKSGDGYTLACYMANYAMDKSHESIGESRNLKKYDMQNEE